MDNNRYIDFEAYERVAEPHKREKASVWRTAIGLQDVDGLKVSDYLKQTAIKHIEGDITIDEVREQLRTYYISKSTHDDDDAAKEEADRVAANIAKLLGENSFSLTALDILGEQNELKNRYMLIGYVGDTPTSTPTSTEQVQVGGNQFITEKENIKRLIVVVGEQKMSVKEMMEATGLKDGKNFLEYTLNPAINEGWVRMLYPDSPRHPRQRYLLTAKGAMLYKEMKNQEN